jgi:hypothetical protein
MNKKINLLGALLLGVFIMMGCENSTNSITGGDELTTAEINSTANSHTGCHDTGVDLDSGADLTAHYINEMPTSSLDITCDVGVYFDEDGEIDGVQLNATVAGAKSRQYGVYVNGAAVKLTDSFVNSAADYPNRFFPVMYIDGAIGTIKNNELTGAHRAGIVLRGVGTDVNVDGNDIIGIGPKSTGWAQNGIQVDSEASGVIKNNLVEGHFWNLDNFVSTGIGVYSDNINVQKNTVRNNDLGVLVSGDRVNVNHNTVEITYSEVDVDGIYGVFVNPGKNSGVRQNSITSNTDTGFGLWVFGTNNAKLIRNDVSGWEYNLIDQGDNTKLPKPFDVY